MFAQFFGGYLLNKNLVTAEDLAQAIEDKANTRARLGVLAINAGLMTAEQVEHINVAQQSVDKRFGTLAVEFGYLTEADVDRLLSEQPKDYLVLGQTLVNNGALTNAQFEDAINNYKAENKLSDEDISSSKNEKLLELVNKFYHFNTAEYARIYAAYVTLLYKNIIRFIGDDFTPYESSVAKSFDVVNIVSQKINGKYKARICIACGHDEYIHIAERFSKESLNEISEYTDAAVGEFLNVTNGLFSVSESNEYGNELTLEPQEFIKSGNVKFEKDAFCIPVAFSFGEVIFIISIYD